MRVQNYHYILCPIICTHLFFRFFFSKNYCLDFCNYRIYVIFSSNFTVKINENGMKIIRTKKLQKKEKKKASKDPNSNPTHTRYKTVTPLHHHPSLPFLLMT